MTPDIRRCQSSDFAAWVQITNAVWPEHPTSLEQMHFADGARAAHCRCERFLAVLGDEPIGLGCASQYEGSYDPRRFELEVGVVVEHRGKGVGRALYEAVRQAISDAEPNWLVSWAREEDRRTDRFLRDRGFEPIDREWEQQLDLTAFCPSDYQAVVDRAAAAGVTVRTLPELAADPDWETRLLALSNELDAYVPSTTPTTDLSLDDFRRWWLGSPHLIPDASLVAVRDGEFIGAHNLWRSEVGDDSVEVGIAAVQPAHRRLGVATLLKLRGLAWAKDHGIASLRTWNSATNTGMLAINQRLGFQKVAVWLGYHWRRDDSATGS